MQQEFALEDRAGERVRLRLRVRPELGDAVQPAECQLEPVCRADGGQYPLLQAQPIAAPVGLHLHVRFPDDVRVVRDERANRVRPRSPCERAETREQGSRELHRVTSMVARVPFRPSRLAKVSVPAW